MPRLHGFFKLDRVVSDAPMSDEKAPARFLAVADSVKQHLAMAFHRFLEQGKFNKLTHHQRGLASDIAKMIRQWREQAFDKLTANEINAGLHILEAVMELAPQLLENMPDDVTPEPDTSTLDELLLDTELVQKAVAWDRRNRVLTIPYHVLLKDIAEGRKTLNTHNMLTVRGKINVLVKRGFKPEN